MNDPFTNNAERGKRSVSALENKTIIQCKIYIFLNMLHNIIAIK